jgi:hypothetical protein
MVCVQAVKANPRLKLERLPLAAPMMAEAAAYARQQYFSFVE